MCYALGTTSLNPDCHARGSQFTVPEITAYSYASGTLKTMPEHKRCEMTASPLKPAHLIATQDLANIRVHARAITAKAMELTDVWGAMFILDEEDLTTIARAIGIPEEVTARLYSAVLDLAYVRERGSRATEGRVRFTWHGDDPLVLVLRSAADLGAAMSDVTDLTVEGYIRDNSDLFTRLMVAMPSYSRSHMFAPEVAARVFASFGATVSPAKLYELAPKYGGAVCEDVEGRKGIATQFIRSVSLTLAATV